ncbi:unnamed protein product [Sphagnum jensenii]
MKVEPEEFTKWFRRYLKASGGVNGVAERTRIPAQTIYGLRAGIDFIAEQEGLSLTAYRDSAGVLTIGYGDTDPDIVEGEKITEAHAKLLLSLDVVDAAKCVAGLNFPLNQNQFDALTDFAFNLGCGALKRLASHGFDSVAEQIPLWVNAGGKEVEGLVLRRLREVALWNKPVSA